MDLHVHKGDGGVAYFAGNGFTYPSWPSDNTFTDSFTYTVSDGHGGAATGTNTVIITGNY